MMSAEPSFSGISLQRYGRWLLLGLLGLWVITSLYHVYKPLPQGVSEAFPLRPAEEIRFLADYTYWDGQERQFEQQIFDETLRLIGQAQKAVVMDMFLFNDFQSEPEQHRALFQELTEALMTRKRQVPDLQVVLITDPFNTLYGGVELPGFEALKAAGVELVLTDLNLLRDSNPSWSGFWRLAFAWAGNSAQGGWLPSPVSTSKVPLRSYLSLLNFKANHRKALVVDEGEHLTGLVMSANAHDGSSAHGNVALRFSGQAAGDLLASELAVAHFSGLGLAEIEAVEAALAGVQGISFATRNLKAQLADLSRETSAQAQEGLQVLTEAEIREALLAAVTASQSGDQIRVSVFYFSHRPLLKALLAAQARGVQLQILLDPNKDAFGRQKNGLPNRQVAWELHRAQVPVRWCDTHGEQCHSKMLMVTGPHRPAELILGSANYTRRNLDAYNLETSVRLIAPITDPAMQEAHSFFERTWHNAPSEQFSTDYSRYADESWLLYGLYRLMEATGWSTF